MNQEGYRDFASDLKDMGLSDGYRQGSGKESACSKPIANHEL